MDSDFEKHADLWDQFIRQETTVWRDFYEYWTNNPIPQYILRYEDILSKPLEVWTEAMCFLLNVESIKGTKIERYVQMAVEADRPMIYKPRAGMVGKNMGKFNQQQLAYMWNAAKDIITKLGYAHIFEESVGATFGWDDSSAAVNKTTIGAGDGDISWMREFNRTNLLKTIERFREGKYIHYVEVNHQRDLLRTSKKQSSKQRETMQFTNMLRDKVTVSGGSRYEKDQSIYARSLDRPKLENRKVWKFKELKEWLLEKTDTVTALPTDDELGILDVSEIIDGMKEEEKHETITLAGYPMSGLEMLRTCFEKLTGTLTGADTVPERPLFQVLKMKEN